MLEEEIKILSLFIGPAILAAVISGFFSLFLSRRSSRLEYITQERGKWRERLRTISEGIQCEDLIKLKAALQLLKVNLNADGIPGNTNEILSFKAGHILLDTHIWTLIFAIEKKIEELHIAQYDGASGIYQDNNAEEGDDIDKTKSIKRLKNTKQQSARKAKRNYTNADKLKEALKDRCELLVRYLSLLLKYDWERSKNEVLKNAMIITGWALMLVGLVGVYAVTVVISGKTNAAWMIITSFVFVIITFGVSQYTEKWIEIKVRDQMTGKKATGLIEIEKGGHSVSRKERRRAFSMFHKFITYSVSGRILIAIAVNSLWMLIFEDFNAIQDMNYVFGGVIFIIGDSFYSYGRKKLLRYEFDYVVGVHINKVRFYCNE